MNASPNTPKGKKKLAPLPAFIILLLLIVIIAVLIFAVDTPVAYAQNADDNCRHMLINKEHMLEEDYVPSSLVALNRYIPASGSVMMTKEAADAIDQMYDAMKAEGIYDIYGSSGYRSYGMQDILHQRKIAYYRNLGYEQEEAQKEAATVVAVPGASEHQSGLAIDFATGKVGLEETFADTPAGLWLAEHSWEYGYILRYPKGKEEITGYIYEPWHFRYIGKIHAEYIHKNKLTLEEYYQLLQQETILTYTSAAGDAYAVYYREYAATQDITGDILSVSRAWADRETGFFITATLSGMDLFDIIGHWAEEDIRKLTSLNIVKGYGNNTFRPERSVSRGELISLAARVYELLYPHGMDKQSRQHIENILYSGTSPYKDVPPDAYYLEPLLKLEQAGILPPSMIIYQAGEKFFTPDKAALRWETALTIAPLLDNKKSSPSREVDFIDMYDADPALQEAVALLNDAGILRGNPSGTFAPDSAVSRAELCAMLCRLLVYFDWDS